MRDEERLTASGAGQLFELLPSIEARQGRIATAGGAKRRENQTRGRGAERRIRAMEGKARENQPMSCARASCASPSRGPGKIPKKIVMTTAQARTMPTPAGSGASLVSESSGSSKNMVTMRRR